MKHYTYVALLPNGIPAYFGKGQGDRIHGIKNAGFEAIRELCTFHHVAYFKTEAEAFTHEAQLIKEYQPHYNIQSGLGAKKWIQGTNTRLLEANEVKVLAARGAESATPEEATQAFMDALPTNLTDETIMFVGDRFSKMLAAFLYKYPNHTGKILAVEKYESEHYIELGKAMEGFEGNNVEPENKDFLTEEFPQVDYVIMNPPFSDTGSGERKLWQKFLTKAQSLAKKGMFILCPIRSTLLIEHTVLIEEIRFASTAALGKAIYVAPNAPKVKTVTETQKYKLSIHISHQYTGYRTSPPQSAYIGVSRNKKFTNLKIRTEITPEDASIWCIQGPDLQLIEQLMEEKDFGAMFTKFQQNKAAKFGHAPSINKSELIALLNQL